MAKDIARVALLIMFDTRIQVIPITNGVMFTHGFITAQSEFSWISYKVCKH